jgi:hypothetical protein
LTSGGNWMMGNKMRMGQFSGDAKEAGKR